MKYSKIIENIVLHYQINILNTEAMNKKKTDVCAKVHAKNPPRRGKKIHKSKTRLMRSQ